MGAWIEIQAEAALSVRADKSLPLWERGLKLVRFCALLMAEMVAPLVGAWIEIGEGG